MSKREVLSHFSIEKETAHRIQANIVNSSKTMSYIFMILIITGYLAYPLVKEMAEKSKKETVVHIAETQVAAFLTPTQIIK